MNSSQSNTMVERKVFMFVTKRNDLPFRQWRFRCILQAPMYAKQKSEKEMWWINYLHDKKVINNTRFNLVVLFLSL